MSFELVRFLEHKFKKIYKAPAYNMQYFYQLS